MYKSYEEYMQSVLGLNIPNNTYMQNMNNNYYQENRMQEANLPEINKLYPEIYGIVYPMIQKACAKRSISVINEIDVNEMVEEIYKAIEPEENTRELGEVKNGDVRNPRAKETRRPNNNYLLRDLIKILVIRELLGGGRPGGVTRPPIPGGMPGPRTKTTYHGTRLYVLIK